MIKLSNFGASLAGAIALLALTSSAQAQGDAARGEKLFVECASCHAVANGENGVGPTLHGVFGRKAGQLANYRYSPALKQSGITWTAQTMDAFIADPQQMVPANRMPYAGLPDTAGRADLIAYLMTIAK